MQALSAGFKDLSVTQRFLETSTASLDLGPYSLWQKVIAEYTKCDLTKPSDKLIALAGIAKHFMSMVEDTYVAGMWRKHPATEITWIAIEECEPRCSRPYRAHSWSWASIDGVVSPKSVEDHVFSTLRVQEVHLEYATQDPTGELLGGYLMLDCQLQNLKLRRERHFSFRLLVHC